MSMSPEKKNELYNACRGIIDSEYDNISDFQKADLYDYLASLFPAVTKEMSDELYREMF